MSTNGFISLLIAHEHFTYLPFPFPITTPIALIAPLWVDLQFITLGAIYSRVTYDPDTLNQVVRMLTDLNPALSDYQPELAVIVTWFKPRLHQATSDISGPTVIVS